MSPLAKVNRKFHREVVLEIKKKRIINKYLARGEVPPDLKDVTLSSADESGRDSAVSDGGINEMDVEFVNDDNVLSQIETRRRFRR